MLAVYQLKLVYFHTLLNHGAKHPIVGGFPCAFSTTRNERAGEFQDGSGLLEAVVVIMVATFPEGRGIELLRGSGA